MDDSSGILTKNETFIVHTGVCFVTLTLQVGAVVLVTCQWTQSATESFTLHWHGTVQVTSVCLVVDRWLFSPTLDVRQTTANWPAG